MINWNKCIILDWDNESTVEVVCLLSKVGNRRPNSYVNLSVDMEEYREITSK